LLTADDCQRSLDTEAQESSRVQSSLCDTVDWLGRVQDSIASLDSVSCDKDRLMLQCRDCEVIKTYSTGWSKNVRTGRFFASNFVNTQLIFKDFSLLERAKMSQQESRPATHYMCCCNTLENVRNPFSCCITKDERISNFAR